MTGVTNAEYFQGVLRRVKRGSQNRLTLEYKDLIKIYYLTEGEKSLRKTCDYFKEPVATLDYIINGNPNHRKGPKIRKPYTKRVRSLALLPAAMSSVRHTRSDAEFKLIDTIMSALDAFKIEASAKLREEFIAKIGGL